MLNTEQQVEYLKNLEGRDHSGDLDEDGRIILTCTFYVNKT
jgi:hypothetical protein